MHLGRTRSNFESEALLILGNKVWTLHDQKKEMVIVVKEFKKRKCKLGMKLCWKSKHAAPSKMHLDAVKNELATFRWEVLVGHVRQFRFQMSRSG